MTSDYELPVVQAAAAAAERAKFVCMKPMKGICGADTWCQRRKDHPGDCNPVGVQSDWQPPHEAAAAERERCTRLVHGHLVRVCATRGAASAAAAAVRAIHADLLRGTDG